MAESKSKKLTPFERFVRAIAGVPKEEMRKAEQAEKRRLEKDQRGSKAS